MVVPTPGGRRMLGDFRLVNLTGDCRPPDDVLGREEAARPYIQGGELVPALEAFPRPFSGFYLYYPARRQTSSALRALIDHLLRLRQSQPPPVA